MNSSSSHIHFFFFLIFYLFRSDFYWFICSPPMKFVLFISSRSLSRGKWSVTNFREIHFLSSSNPIQIKKMSSVLMIILHEYSILLNEGMQVDLKNFIKNFSHKNGACNLLTSTTSALYSYPTVQVSTSMHYKFILYIFKLSIHMRKILL